MKIVDTKAQPSTAGGSKTFPKPDEGLKAFSASEMLIGFILMFDSRDNSDSS